MNRRRYAMGAVLLLVAVLAAACSSIGSTTTASSGTSAGAGGTAWNGKVIALGAIFSSTGIGDAYAPSQIAGAQLAVAQINASGGVRGAHLKLDVRDDGSQPAQSATVMQSLVGSRDLAVLGPTFSNSAMQADPIADQAGLPVLAVSNTGQGIVGTCSYPCDWIFRDSLGEATAVPANVSTAVAASHPASAVVINPSDDAYAVSTAQIATQAFASDGVQVLAPVTFPSATTSLAQSVSTAVGEHPSALMVVASSGSIAASVIKDARSDGFTGVILGSNTFNSQTTLQAAGTAGNGAQSATGWYRGDPSAVNKAFVAAYTAKTHHGPDQFAAQAYTAVELLAQAARTAPLTFTDTAADRSAVRSSLEQVHMVTPLGPFSFTADHDVSQPIWVVAMDGDHYRLVKEVPAT